VPGRAIRAALPLSLLRSLAGSAAAAAPRTAAPPPCPPRPAGGFGRRCRVTGLLLDAFHHIDQHLGRAQIRTRQFVDHLRDDRLALGNLSAPSAIRRLLPRRSPHRPGSLNLWSAHAILSTLGVCF
jgi:hypothetical protein